VEKSTKFVKKSLNKIDKIVVHSNLIEFSVTPHDYEMKTTNFGIIGRVFFVRGINPCQKW
jgi:hypothetical protein